MEFKLYLYFEQLTLKFMEFKTANGLVIFRSTSVTNMEEFLNEISRVSSNTPIIVVQDRPDGTIADMANDSHMKQKYFVVFILKKAVDMQERESVLTSVENLIDRIWSKMVNDKRHDRNGLYFLDTSRFAFQAVGPIGDNYHGVMFSFVIREGMGASAIETNEDFVLQ